MQLATLLIGLISATALWSGVQALNLQARNSYDRAAAAISIAIADDGIGFDAGAIGSGRGLLNMRKRAGSISTGATLIVDSASGRGTTVRLALMVPPGT